MNDITQHSPLESTTTQVWRWVVTQTAGFTFTTDELAQRLPSLKFNRISAALCGLADQDIVVRVGTNARKMVWCVSEKGAASTVIPRMAPADGTRIRQPGYHYKRASTKLRAPSMIVDDIVKLLVELQDRSGLNNYTSAELLAELTRRQS